MYINYSTKGTFSTKHPHQRTIDKFRFNKGGKYKFFSVISYVFLNSRKCIKFLVGIFSDL